MSDPRPRQAQSVFAQPSPLQVDPGETETSAAPETVRERLERQTAWLTSTGPVPAPLQGFQSPAPSASDRAYGDTSAPSGSNDALKPVKSPVPAVPAAEGTPMDTDRAPSIDDVVDPTRPSLDGASQAVVLTIIQQSVNDLYQELFIGQLGALQKDLAKEAPVPETPFALKLLGWVVEHVASSAIGYVGGFLGGELFGHGAAGQEGAAGAQAPAPSAEGRPSVKKIEKTGEKVGEKAGDALKEKMLDSGEEEQAATTGDLLEQFVVREQQELVGRKGDIIARLQLMHDRAAGRAKADTVDLANKLSSLIRSPSLIPWFRNKVTMEWLNFTARVALGPRAEDQSTDMIGANTIDGIASGGEHARMQWRTGGGMIEITVDVDDDVIGTKGLAIQRAGAPSSYGAMQILHGMKGHSLATMPVYRRIWLKTGSSKLNESPAFVITPEGQLEVDVSNPILAAIGSGKPTHIGETMFAVGGQAMTDEDRKDPIVWSQRAVGVTQCMTGAQLIQGMLTSVSTEVLK